MSSALGDAAARAEHLQARLRVALRRIVFMVVPSAVAFVVIGGPIVGLLFQTGRFDAHDTDVVWIVLAGSAIGLSAGTQGRLLGSAFYALGDPRPPLHAALVRVAFWLGYSAVWGGFGLTASAGFAAWIEFLLLRRWLDQRIGRVPIPGRLAIGALCAAGLAGALAVGAARLGAAAGARAWQSSLAAVLVFGAAYLATMLIARVPEARGLTRRLSRAAR
jgi:putative peptidoglycan lipid II flippase